MTPRNTRDSCWFAGQFLHEHQEMDGRRQPCSEIEGPWVSKVLAWLSSCGKGEVEFPI